jgi:hypothetical protein
MSAVIYRASDGAVVWSDAYRSDATMTALLRTGRHIPTRAERAAELENKINQRPIYGYAISLGVAPQFGRAVELFKFQIGATGAGMYDVTKDGQRFLVNTRVGDAPPPSPLIVVQNFDQELRAVGEGKD